MGDVERRGSTSASIPGVRPPPAVESHGGVFDLVGDVGGAAARPKRRLICFDGDTDGEEGAASGSVELASLAEAVPRSVSRRSSLVGDGGIQPSLLAARLLLSRASARARFSRENAVESRRVSARLRGCMALSGPTQAPSTTSARRFGVWDKQRKHQVTELYLKDELNVRCRLTGPEPAEAPARARR